MAGDAQIIDFSPLIIIVNINIIHLKNWKEI